MDTGLEPLNILMIVDSLGVGGTETHVLALEISPGPRPQNNHRHQRRSVDESLCRCRPGYQDHVLSER